MCCLIGPVSQCRWEQAFVEWLLARYNRRAHRNTSLQLYSSQVYMDINRKYANIIAPVSKNWSRVIKLLHFSLKTCAICRRVLRIVLRALSFQVRYKLYSLGRRLSRTRAVEGKVEKRNITTLPVIKNRQSSKCSPPLNNSTDNAVICKIIYK